MSRNEDYVFFFCKSDVNPTAAASDHKKFLERAPHSVYTSVLAEVNLFCPTLPEHSKAKKFIRPHLAREVGRFLSAAFPGSELIGAYREQGVPFTLVGIDPRLFVKRLGIEAALEGDYFPLAYWVKNTKYIDLESIYLPDSVSPPGYTPADALAQLGLRTEISSMTDVLEVVSKFGLLQ